MKSIKFKYKYLLLLLIILFAAFLRFYNLSEMFSFDFDQESGSNIAYSIIKENHIRLIGQELTVGGIFMGPWYYYLLVPFYLILKMDPIGGAIFSVIFSLVIILSYFKISEKMFGVAAGYIAAYIRTITFEQIIHDWSMIPSYACELLVLVTWYLFYKIWSEKDSKHLLPLAFVFGLYPSMYPVLFPLYFVLPIILIIKKIQINIRIFLNCLLFYMIPFSPTLVYEIKFGFPQVKKFLFLGEHSFGERNFFRLIYHTKFNLLEISRIMALNKLPNYFVIAMVLTAIIFLILKKYSFFKNDFHGKALLITYIVVILSFSLIPAHVSENYFISLTTLAFLYISALLSLLNKGFF